MRTINPLKNFLSSVEQLKKGKGFRFPEDVEMRFLQSDERFVLSRDRMKDSIEALHRLITSCSQESLFGIENKALSQEFETNIFERGYESSSSEFETRRTDYMKDRVRQCPHFLRHSLPPQFDEIPA